MNQRIWLGKMAFALVHPGKDLPTVQGAFQRALENPGLVITTGFRCRRQDGSWCHLEVVGQNRLDDPDIVGVVLNTRDITDRKNAPKPSLRESEKQ